MRLIGEGLNNSQIARETGISRTTVRGWRVGNIYGHRKRAAGRAGLECDGSCRSVEHAIDFGDIYSYLLGQYLGDGMLSEARRHVYRLRIACTAAYPEIIDEVIGSVSTIRGSERIGLTDRGGDMEVSSYWKHWICVFPQHGAGPKWKRPITLAGWQRQVVDHHPWPFLRGLVHSDGCRHINTVQRPVAGKIKKYRYSRYTFTNASDDIRGLFTDACDAVGVQWTRANERVVAVSRRADVAIMDRFIGPKR